MNEPAYSRSSIDKILIHEPTDRYILWIIANDKDAFTVGFMIELSKRPSLLVPGANPNIAKALDIVILLQERKMIKVGMEAKVTWRGTWYRIATHPSRPILIGIITLLAGLIYLIVPGANRSYRPKETKTAKDSPDSPLGHYKTSTWFHYFSNNHTDTKYKK